MPLTSLLIANRGEIAIRIARAARDLGLHTVAVYGEDDAHAPHLRACDAARPLAGRGPSAYLDQAAIVVAARDGGCDAVHPGYGFLSENAAFAALCEAEGLTFVGPPPATLALLGDKARARALARELGVPLAAGTFADTPVDAIRDFVAALPAGAGAMIKALAGGGGRGMRAVTRVEEVEEAVRHCRAEALAAFGDGALYVERLVRRARHVEIQVVGDGVEVAHLWERDCTLQRRHQKLVEIAPSPRLDPGLRAALCDAAVRMAAHFPYRSLGTFEFLVEPEAPSGEPGFAFMEANPRLQVEHTVTEEVTGIDLVQAQLQIAAGRSLADLGLRQGDIPRPRGYAVELRINAERMGEQGEVLPAGGTIAAFEPPTGPGIRVDTFASTGCSTNPLFDSLLAKLVVRSPASDFAAAAARAARALGEFRIDGIETNVDVLAALVAMPEFAAQDIHTRFVEERLAALLAAADVRRAGRIGTGAVARRAVAAATAIAAPPGTVAVATPLQGVLASLQAGVGDVVRIGQPVAVLEAMKMEHVVAADRSGRVRQVAGRPGAVLAAGDALLFVEPIDLDACDHGAAGAAVDLDHVRPDLAAVLERHRLGLDGARPDAVARRRKRGQRTARENIADLCDPDSFVEYGALAVAAQRQRRTEAELIAVSPADGLVAGIGTVNAAEFGAERARCMVLSYDFTVLAGTQGWMNHKKKDRLFELAGRAAMPVVVFAEGGGGRPGETDGLSVHGLDTPSFARFAGLSGAVPLVGVVSGRCFAGNAALVGCCDVIIATRDANIGMGGPAMIEGGGLGVFAPEDIGPIDVQSRNGVVDLVAEDEAEAVALAKRYLGYFQGAVTEWHCADQRHLRHLVPENRRRIYDVRAVIAALADDGAVLELRRGYGAGMVTALVRIEGRPIGLMANDPAHLGGAIDTPAALKAARFMDLCGTFGLPVLSLCDTPGFMVGPEEEARGQVRASCAMFLAGARLKSPFLMVVLRKGYGLGAQSMAGGSFHRPWCSVAWPTGEFGGMGLEGAVRLGYRKELEAIADPEERQRYFDRKLARLYEHGKAVTMAAHLEIDAVIDPADTRRWIVATLQAAAVDRGDKTPPGGL